MPRSKTNKMYRSFVKGLISEASPLTYPENASIDEDNCQLFQAGNRTRRLGLERESDYQLSSYLHPAAGVINSPLKEYVWHSVDNDSNLNFLVRQCGRFIRFYRLATGAGAISANEKSFQINMADYTVDEDFTTVIGDAFEFASGNGFLFITGAKVKPVFVEYDPLLDTIAVAEITIKIRDFKGVNDGLANDEEPTTLTDKHKYNLMNQGWINATNDGSGPEVTHYNDFVLNFIDAFVPETLYNAPGSDYIELYHTATGRYPGNNKQWWVAKAASDSYLPEDLTLVHEQGEFVPDLLEKYYAGNNLAPRGHYVVDAFRIDRSAVSGVAGLDVEETSNRPNVVAFYAGRPFYVVNSDVFYSQILSKDKTKVGSCFQDADPTSEDISDLLATDGGVVNIPEMRKVCKAFPFKDSLLLFAENGIWSISGGKGGFDATDFSVEKVSNFGTYSPNSIVEAQDALYFWANSGIYRLSFQSGPFGATGKILVESISQGTIQTWFNQHTDLETVKYAKVVYDEQNNLIQWTFQEQVGGNPADDPGANAPVILNNPYFHNRVLNLDLNLNAFFPWSFSHGPAHPIPTGMFVWTGSGDPRKNRIVYIIFQGVVGGYRMTFAKTKSYSFSDWGDLSYNSYVNTGYELLDDMMRKKEANYVFTYVRRSEQEFIPDGTDYDVDFPSSCLLQVKWDWTNSPGTGKWTPAHEIYRHTRFYGLTDDDLAFDDGYPVVVTKSKVRGTGRAIQFKFSNNLRGSDFDLLGWAVNYSGSPRV